MRKIAILFTLVISLLYADDLEIVLEDEQPASVSEPSYQASEQSYQSSSSRGSFWFDAHTGYYNYDDADASMAYLGLRFGYMEHFRAMDGNAKAGLFLRFSRLGFDSDAYDSVANLYGLGVNGEYKQREHKLQGSFSFANGKNRKKKGSLRVSTSQQSYMFDIRYENAMFKGHNGEYKRTVSPVVLASMLYSNASSDKFTKYSMDDSALKLGLGLKYVLENYSDAYIIEIIGSKNLLESFENDQINLNFADKDLDYNTHSNPLKFNFSFAKQSKSSRSFIFTYGGNFMLDEDENMALKGFLRLEKRF